MDFHKKITKNWELFDLRVLQEASVAYQNAKIAYATARKSNKPKEWDEAKKAYEAVLKLINIDTATHIEYAEICRKFGDYDKAIEHFNRAIKRKDERPELFKTDQSFLHSKLLQVYCDKEDYASAFKQFKKIKKPKMINELRPLIKKIMKEKEEYKKQIIQIGKEYKINFDEEYDSHKDQKISILRYSKYQEYGELTLLYLDCYNGALEGTIKNKITLNTKINGEVLTLLLDYGLIEHKKIKNYNVFFITEEGRNLAKAISIDEQYFKKISDEQTEEIVKWYNEKPDYNEELGYIPDK